MSEQVTDTGAALLMLRTFADTGALARWAAATGQRALREDPGYALHAALKATLGSLAPKPFVLVPRQDESQLIGYVRAAREGFDRALQFAAVADVRAATALGLDRPGLVVKTLPKDWRCGERLDFEIRVAPVVRSRATPGGGYVEVDAAFHAAFHVEGDR